MNRRAVQPVLIALLVVATGSICSWILLGRPATGIDDADIFFVYAKHLAEGHGLVYNMGGERVEGFTSLLWMLICSCLFRVTDHVEIPLYLINLLLGAATIWACLKRAHDPGPFLLLLAAVPAWFAWCQVTLMETGLWCCLLTLAVLAAVDRRTVLFALLLSLLVITRPESMLWGAWLILMMGVALTGSGGWRTGFSKAALPVAVFAAALAVLVAFRTHYFGFPVPNTYYAKVSPSFSTNLWNGTGYLLKYLIKNPVVFPVMITWGWILARGLCKRRNGLDERTLIALCLLPGIGIPVLVGGDHFGGARFYQPIWPLLCLLAAMEWPVLFAHVSPVKARIALLLLVLCGWGLFPVASHLRHEFRIAREGREVGAALEAMFHDLDSLPTIATITAGGSKYGYPGTVYDLMGLNATEMAHAPGPRTGYKNHTAFNRDVFYAWHPDVMLCGEDPEFDAYVLKGLLKEDRFNRMYARMELERNGRGVKAYYSHAFLEQVHQVRHSHACAWINAGVSKRRDRR